MTLGKNGSFYIIGIVLFLGQFYMPDAQDKGGDGKSMIQPRRLIDAHTAGILPKAFFDFETRIYPSGSKKTQGSGINLSIGVAITHRLNVGISYGGDGLIGREKAKGNPYPGGLIKYRLFEETTLIPGIAIGYEHQGYGGIEDSSYIGFVYKSQGFFLAVSKNFLVFNKIILGIHSAVNFSLEEIKKVTWPNCYVGIDIGINEEMAFSFEYDIALNQKDRFTEKYNDPLKGFFNIGLRWAFDPRFYIEFDVKDIFQQKRLNSNSNSRLGWSRELKIVYITDFLM